jgi:hypothetical protein
MPDTSHLRAGTTSMKMHDTGLLMGEIEGWYLLINCRSARLRGEASSFESMSFCILAPQGGTPTKLNPPQNVDS